nr:unnamed protein product [Callosobruchus analis]
MLFSNNHNSFETVEFCNKLCGAWLESGNSTRNKKIFHMIYSAALLIYGLFFYVLQSCLAVFIAGHLDLSLLDEAADKSPQKWIRKLKPSGLNKFVSRLNDKNWTIFDNCQDINLLADKLVSNYASLIETCFPLQRQNSDKQPVKWFNEDLRRMRDTLRSIKIIYNVTKNTSDKLVYEKFKKKYREAIQHTKKLRYDNFITCSQNKSKASWRLVNYELKRNIKDTHSNLDVNLVNRYFSTVAANILSSLPPNKVDTSNYLNFVNKPNVTFFLSPVTESEVTETINNLSSSECPDAFGSYVTNSIIHNYNTRNAKLLRPPRHHLYMTEKNSVNISHYNRLPENLKKLNTYLFKKKLMSFFKSHCFYTVKDFESFESSINQGKMLQQHLSIVAIKSVVVMVFHLLLVTVNELQSRLTYPIPCDRPASKQ